MDDQERNREALIDHIAEQDRIIRRRNQQIENQARNAEEDQRAIEAIEAERDEYRAMHSQQMKTIARLQETPRPLTADDITDEMVKRALNAYRDERLQQGYVMTNNGGTQEAMSHALRAALTPPPSRPEGAEGLDEVCAGITLGGFSLNTSDLADYLAARGVRVTGKDN